jgi:CRISPR/Cas system-associated exonuclease Cas4 (RecB family)
MASFSRKRNLFDPTTDAPFKLSRFRLENFLRCKRCFYLDRRLGIDVPPGYPFNLNTAVDTLLKKEFDIHRTADRSHPMMTAYGLDLKPYNHPKLNEWRENFKGVMYHHEATNMIITGAVDDLWCDDKGTIYVVDYKATSKEAEVTLDADWQIGYKRQMEMYQWLLRRNGLTVSDTGYFVYCNGKTDREAFDGKLEFDIKIIPYTGNDSWVEKVITQAHACLVSDRLPVSSTRCEFCQYRKAAASIESR